MVAIVGKLESEIHQSMKDAQSHHQCSAAGFAYSIKDHAGSIQDSCLIHSVAVTADTNDPTRGLVCLSP